MGALTQGAAVLQTVCGRASPPRQGADQPHSVPEQVREDVTGTVWDGRDDTRGREGGDEAGSAPGLWEPERLWGWWGWDDSDPRGAGGTRGVGDESTNSKTRAQHPPVVVFCFTTRGPKHNALHWLHRRSWTSRCVMGRRPRRSQAVLSHREEPCLSALRRVLS